MSFPFRRRRDNQFKHIAHGLIPAATVAPRSAVPRTPPPRSPNPSPERPRSALAAAILMTSLTGRTIAIPQPRQRSYSENDSTYMDRTDQIEPYATARDLEIQQNWKANSSRGNLRSPVMSFEFEDDDDDTGEQMSDIEQVSQRRDESTTQEPLYAIPHKTKQKKTKPPERADVEGGRSSPEVVNYPAESELHTTEECKVDAAAESPIPPPHSEEIKEQKEQLVRSGSSVVASHKASERHQSQEEDPQWRAAAQQLTGRNLELASQVEELKQQIKTMRVKVKNLKNEKRGYQELLKNPRAEVETAELVSLQEQAQELVDENDALKTTIHRLNVELSRYQTKYRPISKEEGVRIGGLPSRGPPPPWLLDMKYLSPLLLAYEDRINEKDNLILGFEEELKTFKARVKEVIEENEKLHQLLTQDRPVSNKEWEGLQAQHKLLMEENRILTEQLEVQEGKSRENHSNHVLAVSELTKQLMVLESTKRNQEEELLEFQKQQEVLRSKYNDLKATMDGSVSAEEHVAMVNELKSQLQQQQENGRRDAHDLMGKMTALQAEKKALLLQRNDLLADNKILEAEVEAVKKSNRKMQRRVGQLKQQLEDAMEKEVTAHQYLANLITLAESIAGERDELINMTKGLEAEKRGALSTMMEGGVRLGRLEEMVKVYRKKAASTVQGITHKLTEQEEDFAGKAAQYQREMKYLRWLLQDRQQTLSEVLQQKRQVEEQLEVIWESAANDNKELKTRLHAAMRQKNPGGSDFFLQQDSIVGYSFSYCDVNSSSHGDDPLK
ncbi:centrosomal protein of 89 kDa isoform X1 [Bufo gargarizans]|uniref:centrosomal protein of 89 kDa isoform X1 n=1 Tax=Bufo gargarizans TaxID=30331 RepID=UPI001CF0E6EA|nr:centrosomal protein of 89 kDa isoform X1 [Bufo gargarizans]